MRKPTQKQKSPPMSFALLSAYIVAVIAMMSPGPDFAVTVQTSVRHGGRAGIFTALGIACGTLVHFAYINIGLGALIAHSVVAFNVMKFAAALYLGYIGFKALRSQPKRGGAEENTARAEELSDARAFRRGFVTNALNPKAALFFLSYFTLVVDPNMPAMTLAGFVTLLAFTTAAWFSLVSWGFSRPRVREQFLRLGHWFDRTTGAILVALGVRVALAHH
jgi:RhtB (resistance to homoserine/threonine) family protein